MGGGTLSKGATEPFAVGTSVSYRTTSKSCLAAKARRPKPRPDLGHRARHQSFSPTLLPSRALRGVFIESPDVHAAARTAYGHREEVDGL